MKELYNKILRENHYIFAHYFLSFFGAFFATLIFSFSDFERNQYVYVIVYAINFIGLLYEFSQHRFKVLNKDSLQDMAMNLFGSLCGVLML